MNRIETKPLGREHHAAFLALYNDSFAAEERRDYTGSAALEEFIATHKEHFHIQVVEVDGRLSGFITYWNFGEFGYVEHLAIAPDMRSEGLGSLLLADLLDVQPRIILELERPEDKPDDRARLRRISFYKRHDFRLHPEVEYVQPAYAADKPPVPMYLASSGCLAPTSDVIATLRREVYGV